jgi:iron complex transport system permease protein
MTATQPLLVVIAGTALTLIAVVASLTIGVIHVPMADVVHALTGICGSGTADSLGDNLVRNMRLPRAIGAVCVGAALGAAGCMLQALLRNPLASPTVIGTSQAAAFGKVLGVFIGIGYAGSIGVSFLAACGGALLVLALARTRSGLPVLSVVLMGINMSLFFAALTGLMVFLSRDEDQLARMALMLAGGLWRVSWGSLSIIAPATALACVAALFFARALDILALGEGDAKRLGLNAARTGTAVLLIACLATSLAVSLAGVVAFVGLIVPHAARRIVGHAHRVLLPACILLGATLVVATDTLARSIAPPHELPLGVVTSLLGVPCFIIIVRSMQRRSGEA